MTIKNAAPLLRIVQNKPVKDVIETLEYLLQEAREGNLIGLAYGGMLSGNRFIIDAAGAAHCDPLSGLGVIQVLTHELTARARGS